MDPIMPVIGPLAKYVGDLKTMLSIMFSEKILRDQVIVPFNQRANKKYRVGILVSSDALHG